jgi:hypothetical protein
MKSFLISIIGSIAAALSLGAMTVTDTQAQTSSHGPAGPFADVASLKQAWREYVPYNSNTLFLDGQLIYSATGFGPAASGRYVTCSDTLIHHDVCPVVTLTSHGPQGPFANSQALVQAWQAFVPYNSNTLWLDGQLIFSAMGFGPPASGRYVTCSDSLIYRDVCPSVQQTSHGPTGPFADIATLTQAWQVFVPYHTNWLYLDGQLIHSGIGFGPAAYGNYVTCPSTLIYRDVCPVAPPPPDPGSSTKKR